MPTVGPQFQPVLPGLGPIRRAAPKAVGPVTPHPVNSGPQPGQLVMGVADLARGREVDRGFHRVPSSRFPGGTKVVSKGTDEHHYEVDAHGYVQEGYGSPPHHDKIAGGVTAPDPTYGHVIHPAASDLFGTHGGRFAKTVHEAAAEEGSTPSDFGITAGTAKMHDARVKEVREHWDRQPLVQFPTSQLVHSTQDVSETEGDVNESVTARTTGGRTRRGSNNYGTGGKGARQYTTPPGAQGEGRQRIEAIKADLAKGGQIRKPIWMTKVNGRFFQLDGHHRMVAAREMGLSHVPVRLWDQDAEKKLPWDHELTSNPAPRAGINRFKSS